MNRLPQYDVFEIPTKLIFYDEDFNCRGLVTTESIQSLAGSIKTNGLLHPIIVQPWGDKYRIIAGHRRYKATLYLKQPTIKASIRTDLIPHQAYLLNFTENLDRKDLNIFEEAAALRRLYPDGVSLNTAARELHKPTRWVHIRLRLLLMPEEVQQHAASGMLSAVNLEALVGKEPNTQIILCRKIVEARKHDFHLRGLDEECKRSFKHRRSKGEMNEIIRKMMELNITGLGPRSIAWCASQITTEELMEDIKRYKSHGVKSRSKKYR